MGVGCKKRDAEAVSKGHRVLRWGWLPSSSPVPLSYTHSDPAGARPTDLRPDISETWGPQVGERQEGCTAKKRYRASSESPPSNIQGLTICPGIREVSEAKLNLSGLLKVMRSFGSHRVDMTPFRFNFPTEPALGVSEAGTACDSRQLTAIKCLWPCWVPWLCQSQGKPGWLLLVRGRLGMSDCNSHIGKKAESLHAVLLAPTFPCSPSVQQKSSVWLFLILSSGVLTESPQNFLALALVLIYSARAASMLVGFLV